MGEGRKRAEVLESSSSYSKDQVYQAYGGQPSKAAGGAQLTGCLELSSSKDVRGVHGTWGSQGASTQHMDVQQQPATLHQAGGRSQHQCLAAVTCLLCASWPQAQLSRLVALWGIMIAEGADLENLPIPFHSGRPPGTQPSCAGASSGMYPTVDKPDKAPAYAPWMAARVSDEGLPGAAAGVEEAVPQQEQPAAQSRLGLASLQEPRPAAQVSTVDAAWEAVLAGGC